MVKALSTVMGWLGPDRSLAGRVALFSSAVIVGPSFEPGLQPRRTAHQALATGVLAAFTLTSVSATQSSITAIGRILGVDRSAGSGSRAAFQAATNLGFGVLAQGIVRALPPHVDEPARRGLVRTIADRYPRIKRVPIAFPALHIHGTRWEAS